MRVPSWKSRPAAARAETGLLDAVLAASEHGILVTDASHTVVVANDAFCTSFGWCPRDLIGGSLPGRRGVEVGGG